MVGTLLLRGMLVGVLAGLLCFCFLKIFGEPEVDRAIAFETQMDEAKEHAQDHMHMAHDHSSMENGHAAAEDEHAPELVSRPVQASFGLLTGTVVYSAAFGGLFALAFAGLYGRIGRYDARTLAALLAAAGFIALYLVPSLKYPANPPSIGEADTIGMRTALYFGMIALSLVAMIAAVSLHKALAPRFGAWNASLIAAGLYLCLAIGASLMLPPVNEVPEQFPATVLWQFRIAALGSQLVMWAALGLVFGALTARTRHFLES